MITIDNIKKWKDWGMVLTPAIKSDDKKIDKKAVKPNGEWSANWTDNDLLKAKRIALFHQPEKQVNVNGKNFLTIDFDDPKFVASSFSSLFPISFTIGKKDSTGSIKVTHIEYEIDPKDKPDKLPSYFNSIEALGKSISIIAGVDRYTIIDMQPTRLFRNEIEYVLKLVDEVNYLQKLKKRLKI